jgi:PAS domain-containing protein
MNSDPLSLESTFSSVASEVTFDPDFAQSPKIDAPFPIVGIAASAGGLEAFTELIRHLPTDTGMAFVLIQHLSPNHESLLSEILGRVTKMPVREVEDRMMVEANEVYVIPPNTQMTLKDGMLHLAPRQKKYGKYLPGDAYPAEVKALYEEILIHVTSFFRDPTDISAPIAESLNPASLEREIIQLRQALAAAKQRELSAQAHLQAVIQEQNYLNQSLRVANEEILSSNEELQSTNEELQTAKEEIQVTNEQLSTTNDELRSRNLQQNRDNSDLNNFLSSISIPIVMLTNDLRIRRFTPTAQRLFNFIPTDIGRPFRDLRVNFDVPNLESMIMSVLETLNTQEQEIQTQAGYWYSLRIRPYLTTENQIDGVTMLFVDIDALKRNASTLESARNYAEAIIDTVQTPLVVLDTNIRVNTVNRSFYEMFQVSALETAQLPLLELGIM